MTGLDPLFIHSCSTAWQDNKTVGKQVHLSVALRVDGQPLRLLEDADIERASEEYKVAQNALPRLDLWHFRAMRAAAIKQYYAELAEAMIRRIEAQESWAALNK